MGTPKSILRRKKSLKQVQNIPETVSLTQTLTKKSNKNPQNLSEKNQTFTFEFTPKTNATSHESIVNCKEI